MRKNSFKSCMLSNIWNNHLIDDTTVFDIVRFPKRPHDIVPRTYHIQFKVSFEILFIRLFLPYLFGIHGDSLQYFRHIHAFVVHFHILYPPSLIALTSSSRMILFSLSRSLLSLTSPALTKWVTITSYCPSLSENRYEMAN